MKNNLIFFGSILLMIAFASCEDESDVDGFDLYECQSTLTIVDIDEGTTSTQEVNAVLSVNFISDTQLKVTEYTSVEALENYFSEQLTYDYHIDNNNFSYIPDPNYVVTNIISEGFFSADQEELEFTNYSAKLTSYGDLSDPLSEPSYLIVEEIFYCEKQ